MVITVGGLMITSGIMVSVITVITTLFVAFATGMSDNPSDRMSWKWPAICMAFGLGLIFTGVRSGL